MDWPLQAALLLCQDEQGVIWVGTRMGLFRLGEAGFRPWRSPPVLEQAAVNALVATRGELWVGSEDGLVRIAGEGAKRVEALGNRRIERIERLALDSLGRIRVMAGARWVAVVWPGAGELKVELGPPHHFRLHAGRSGDFWIAGRDGSAVRLSGADLTHSNTVARFEGRRVASMHEDREGNLWVGVRARGLYRLRKKQVTTYTLQDGLPSDHVSSVFEDRAGRIWLGTFRDNLLVSEKGDLNFRGVGAKKVVNSTALCETRSGQLWFGSYNGRDYLSNGVPFNPMAMEAPGSRCILEDQHGAMWVGRIAEGLERVQGDRVTRFTTKDGLFSDRINCLALGAVGDLWVGTQRGLNRLLDGKVVPIPVEGPASVLRHGVRGLKADRNGAIWVATAGAGLGVFRNGALRMITARHGLVTDWIEDLVEDDDGHLWLPSDKGILRVRREEALACADGRALLLSCATLAEEDGIAVAQFGSGFKPSCIRARDGTLWFVSSGGLVLVNPRAVTFPKDPLQIYIEEVRLDDQLVPVPREGVHGLPSTRVPAGTQKVQFRYTAAKFSGPENVQFRYRLEGIDHDWISAGSTREVSYSRLPPGSYQFRVRAADKSGIWTESAAAWGILVVAPWWQTWWFRAAVALGLGALVFGGYERRLRRLSAARAAQERFSRRLIETQEQERRRVAHELHDSLGQAMLIIKGRAQIGLSRSTADSESARRFEEIANATAQAIDEVRSISHALRPPELDQLGLTKALEWMADQASAASKTRFATDLDDLDGECSPELAINLYRIVQEGISNVLRHAEAKKAILEFKREGSTVRLSLFDNGKGFDASSSPKATSGSVGLGLGGIAERVRLLGGEFELQSAPGRGTRLTVICRISPGGP